MAPNKKQASGGAGGKPERLLPYPVSKEGGEVKLSEQYSGMLDWQIFRAAKTPGPGAYDTSQVFKLPNGGHFSQHKSMGYCDDQIKRALTMPGPADYPAPKLPETSGGRFSEGNPKSELDWIQLRAAETPGPTDIPAPKFKMPSGGRFSRANPKTDVEWTMYQAAQKPGPADYHVPPPAPPTGGRFGNARPKSELDWIMIRQKNMPGPGQYSLKQPEMGGGRFNLSKAKSDLDWVVYRAAQVPGPGQYDAAKSLEALTKTPSCRILGRTGPRQLPYPYGGPKPPPPSKDEGRDHGGQGRGHSATTSAAPGVNTSHRSGHGGNRHVGRPQRPSAQVGAHPLAEDPSSPLHRRRRLAKSRPTRSHSAMSGARDPAYIGMSRDYLYQ